MKRKLLALFLCLALILCATGCAGAEKEPENTTKAASDGSAPTELTGVVVVFSEDSEWPTPTVKRLEEDANVHITWSKMTLADWSTKKGILMAGDTIPDIFFATYMTDTEANSGIFADLAPYLDGTTNIKAFFAEDPEAKVMCTNSDGTIYSLPSKVAFRPASKETLFVATQWCEDNNVKIPTTTDEFEAYLKAFVASDVNGNGIADEKGISFAGVATGSSLCQLLIGADSLCAFFPAFGAVANDETLCMVDNGTVRFVPTMEGFKEACKWLNKLYAENLIDPDSFTQAYADQATKYRNENGLTIAAGSGWSIVNVAGDNAEYYERIAPLVGPNGDQYWQSNPYQYKYSPNTVAISADCNDIPAAMRFVDLCYDNYTNFVLSYGEDGVCVTKDADGTPRFVEVPEGMTDIEFHLFNGALDAVAPGWVSDAFESSIQGDSDMRFVYESDKFYEPYFLADNQRYPYVRWDKETQDELAILQTDIDGYVDRMIADFVMNGDVDERWDDYLSKLDDMGLVRLMEIYQNAYNVSIS